MLSKSTSPSCLGLPMLNAPPASFWISSSSPAIFCAKAPDMRESVSRSTLTPAISISASTGTSGRSSVS